MRSGTGTGTGADGRSEARREAAVEHCHAESHRQALARIDPDNPQEDQIFGALDGKMGYLYRRAVSTRHGAQVAGMSFDLGTPVTQLWGRRYLETLTSLFEKAAAAGEIDLSRCGAGARTVAGMLILNAEGQQGPVNDRPAPDRYSRRLRRLVRMLLLSLGGTVRSQP